MYRALCPDCGELLELKESVQVGDRIVCVECGIELEVLSRYPLDLDYVLDDAWDDDWGEDEEEVEAGESEDGVWDEP
jgi:lysine biosynthesis protein LysW